MKKIITMSFLMYTSVIFADSIGTVLSTINNVIAKHDNKERVLSRGASLETDDIIITTADAKAQIKYSNGTLVSIEPNSNYRTGSYTDAKNQQLQATLNSGAIDYKSNGKKKGVLKTPVVALAILGTGFKVIVPTIINGKNVTGEKMYVDVSVGRVQGKNTILGPNENFSSGSFDKNGTFTPGPIPWGAAQQGRLSQSSLSTTNNIARNTTTTTNTNTNITDMKRELFLGNLVNILIPTITSTTSSSIADVQTMISIPAVAVISIVGCS